jgi:hypothetical protein
MSHLNPSKKKYRINGITFYYDYKEEVITQFITAEFLLWEKNFKEQKICL